MKQNILEFFEKSQYNQPIKEIYLDYQASTPIDKRVLQAMLPFLTTEFGNPHSSEHFIGWNANAAVEAAQENIADYIGALPEEIIFTSGATESNNLVIIGLAYAAMSKNINRRTILVSSIEHKCVLGAARFLTRFGFTVQYIPVTPDGIIDMEKFRFMLNEDILLVSVMTTNNEIGTVQPIKEIGELCSAYGILFHTDAAQACYENLDVFENNVDFMSLSSHKIYGPKGIGALYISNKAYLKPEPIMYGGGQQSGYRSGTIPTFLVVGFGEAANIMISNKETERSELEHLRGLLLEEIQKRVPNIKVNGSMSHRHPGNLNLLIPTIESKQLIYSIQPDVAFSTGSACTSGVIEPSHVLKAIGLSTDAAEHSFRITVGRFTDESDIKKAAEFISNKANT
jgi:cysteine desulfurase